MTGSRFVPGSAARCAVRRFLALSAVMLLGALALSPVRAATLPDVAVTVRHAPQLNGQGRIEGSIQQNLGESVTINGGALVTQEFLVPGTPAVQVDNNGSIGSQVQDQGSAQPSNYQIRVTGGASILRLRTQVDAASMPVVAAPPAPQGTRNVTLNKAGENVGNWATVRNLQLNGQAGMVDVPPGTYGELTANSSSVLRVGVAGSLQPAVYNIQRLTLNGQSRLEVLGPVILHLANGFNANGQVGAAAHPEWLGVRIAKGGVQLNGGSLVYGALIAPSGTIIINGQATLCGTALCDRFILNGGGLVRWCNTSGDGGNRPPVANGQTLTTAEDQQVEITLSASDPDGNTLAYTVTARTQHGSLAGIAPNLIYTPDPDYSGPDSFSFSVSDGIASSAPAAVSIQVQPVNDAPVALPGSVVVTEDTPLLITLQASDADGDLLSFSIPEQTMKGWLEKDTSPSAGAGDYFYWPHPDSNEPDSFVFRVADGQGGVSEARIQITINPVDDKPLVAPLSLEVPEDGQLALTLTGTDADGDVLIVRPMAGTGPFNGTLEGGAPDFTYRPAANFHGTDTFWYEAVDAQGNVSVPAQVSIRVAPVDDAPVALSTTVPLIEDTPVAFTVDASDIEGEPLTFRIIQQPVKGTLSGAGPDFVYTPHANVSGEDSFTFEAIDSADPQGLVSAPATVIFQVASVNDAPVAQPVAVVTREDVPVTITLSGSDVDGDALTYLVPRPAEEGQSFGPQHGTLTPTENSQVWIYTPALHSDVPDQFTFRVQDPEGLVSDAVVAIRVTARDNPVAIPLTLSLPEDGSQQLTLSGSGAEDTTVHFELGDGQGGGTAPANGALSGEIPELIYTPIPNYFGADQFSYVAVDSFGQRSAPALVSIDILPVNDAPVAQAQALSTDEDTSIEIHFQASDLENDPVTFLEPTEPSFGILEQLGPGHYRYHPGANFHGTDTFFYATNDGAADSLPAAVTIQVRPVNDAPEAHPQGLSTREDTPLSLVLYGSDIDGDALTILEPSTPQHGTLTRDPNAPARFTYVPHPDFHGSDSFTFTVKDREFISAPALIAIEVEPVNDAPSTRDLAVETPEDTPVNISLPATDPDGETLRFEILSAPAKGTLSAITGQGSVRYQPSANVFGEDRFVFRSIDPAGESSEATVTITIHSVNDAPVAESRIVEVLEDSASIIGLIGEDVDGDVLSYHITIQPRHGILTGSGPNIRYQPHENYSGPDSFQFVVKDATLTSAPAEVLISVLAVNDRPTAAPGNVELDEDSFVAITLNGHDEEGSPLTYRVVTPPEHGVLTGIAPDLIYTPVANYNGQDTFHFVVRDDEGDSVPAIITLNVRTKNDPPTAQSLAVETVENVAVSVVLVAEDPDGDALTYTITQSPKYGTLSGTAPDLTYTPRAGYFGADSFEFSVNDTTDATAKANVSISVQPDARSRTFTTTEDFEEGYLTALSADPADQLQTSSDLSRFDVLWIPKSSTNTVCRLDTETGRVLSEHRVAPNAAKLGYPSRVAIDSSGDAWVGDQHGGGLVKITSPESGRWVDRNNNGYLDTSTGQGDVRPWTGDANDTGAGAADELILLRVNTGLSGVRAIAIDRSENVWVSGTGKDDPWMLIDGKTGAILRQEPNVGRGGWMAFADFDGSLYSTGAKFLRWDTDGPISELDNRFDSVIANSWDVAKDSNGNFWVTAHYNSYVFKYSSKGELLGSYYHGRGSTEGIVIDNDDHVWIAHSHCGHTVGHLAPDGTFLGEIPIALPTELAVDRKGRVWISDYRGVVARINALGGPLGNDGKTPLGEIDLISQSLNGNSATLGDFAGRGAAFTAGRGTWTFDYDGVIPNVSWGPLTWNALISNDGSVNMSVSVSNDGVNYTPFQPLTLENATPSAKGRYLRGKVEIASATTGESPILYDLTVGTSGYAIPETPRYWLANAGPDLESNWPDVVELKGAWCRTAHRFNSQPTYAWTKVSGPGAVTFDDPQALRPKVQFGANGTYVLRLSATLDGETKTDDVVVNLTPRNRSPWVDGGRDVLAENANELVKLKGSARDDGLPLGRTVEIRWEKKAGPGIVTFTNPTDPQTTASFSAPGVYLLELSSYDGEFTATDMIEARVAVPCTISDIAGLNAWWQGSFDGIDHVGGNIALLERGVTFEQGNVGGAYKFDGVDDHLRLFAAPTLDVGDDTGLSLEFWMKADVLRDATLFEYGNDTAAGVSVRMRTNGNLELHLVDVDGLDRVLTAVGLIAGQFRHVVITWDRASGRAVIYLDGVPKVFGDLGTKAAQTTSDLFIGVNRSGAQPFKGLIDEISLYSRALAAEEAYDLFAADLVGKCPPGSNMAPDVDAGPYLVQKAGIPVALKGNATDDGLPAGGRFRAEWSVVAAPDQATVTFENPADPQTHATFSADGFYTLKLTATDGAIIAVDYATVPVGNDCLLEADTGLVGWWPGDGTSEDLVGGRTGEFAAGHIYGTGKVERAFRLDGTNYVRVPMSVDEQGSNSLDVGKGSWTVELWAKPDAYRLYPVLLAWQDAAGAGPVFSQGGEHLFVTTPGGGSQNSGAGVLPAGQWTHIAVSYERTTGSLRFYANGQLTADRSIGANLTFATNKDLWIGGHAGADKFRGLLDEVSIYNRALGPDEIASICEAGAVGKCRPSDNHAPRVNAGPDLGLNSIEQSLTLRGSVSDDGLPEQGGLLVEWKQLSGPGVATFAEVSNPQSPVSFSAAGRYELELSARDGIELARDVVEITVGQPCVIGEDASLVGWWSGNRTTEDVLGEHDGYGAFITYEPGKVGSAFKLNGGSYVRVPVSVDEQGNNSLDVGKGSWTVELWANPDAYRLYPVLLAWQDAAGAGPVFSQNGNYLFVSTPVGSRDSGAGVLPAGQWTHIAVSYERTTGSLRFYANGQLTADRSIGANLTFATNKDLWIGGHAGADKFRGLLDEVSIYNRALAPTDIATLFNAGSIGKCHPQPPNAAPVAQAGADRSIQLPRNYLILAGTATDDGLPSGSTLAYEWSQVSGPGEVSLSNPASPTATATFPLRGSYVLRLSVSDGALSSEDDITVTVLPPENQAPEVNAGIDRVISIQEPSITLSGSVEDDGEPQGSTVSTSWSKISGPGDVIFADRFDPNTQTIFSAVGTYVLQLAATDGTRTGTDTVQVRVVTPPSIRISSPANYTLVSPGGIVTATAAVTAPDAPIVSVEFFLDGTGISAGTAAPYTVTTPSLADGVHTLTAQAVDSNGLRATSLPLTLRAATDSGVAPSVTIANVENGHVITAPTEITGTVQSPILREWSLEYCRLNDDCAEWIAFKTGAGSVENGILGIFDPTLLLNGNYALRLTARDFANRAVATTRIVVVEGDMKVGHFTVAFQDLQLPLAGLPLTVTRTYDSRDRCPGDFGFGWRLDLETIRLEKSHRIGDGWETQVSVGSPSYYQIADSVSHQLSVKMPDGELLRFQPKIIIDRPYNRLVSLLDADGDDVGQVFAPIAYQQPLRVIYRARGGHRGATLRALNYRTDGGFFGGGVRNVPGDGQFYISDQMEGQLLLAAHDNSAQEAPFMLDATGWELTIQDGRVFVFDAEGRLSSMRDRSGRSLTITRDFQGRVQKVRHSSGQEIVFARNQSGFVQSVTDPRGNVLRYVYNAAGDLQQFFDRGTDPQADLPSTSFIYATGTHFLTDLRDARGVQAAKNFYDQEGRLWKTVDAQGKETVFTHNIEGRIETIRDRAGQVTRHHYDTRGNIVRTESPDGTVTTMAYHRWSDGVLSSLKTSETISGFIADSTGQKVPQTLTTFYVYEDDDPATPPANDGLLRKLVDPKGNVTRFTYDANGNVLTTTDARANAAGGNPAPTLVNTYYPGTDHIQTTTDALGNVTSFTYDPKGNLDKETRQVTVTGASGETTVQTLVSDYDYDSFGRLVKVTDALGHATTYEYDLNGNRVKEITTRTGADGKLVTLVTEHEYDANDRLTRSWLPDNPRSNFNTPPSSETLYDENGKVAVTYDALRRGTVNEYNERGELIRTTFPDGATEKVVYDAEGRREATIDRRGMRTQYVYDAMGRLKETWFVGNGGDAPVRLSITEYDATGRVWKSTDANGNTTTYGYDAAGRRVLVKDAKNRSSVFGFDENGNQTTFTDHYGRTTTHVYDALNRRTHTVYPAAEIWTGTAYESKITEIVTVYDELGRRTLEYEQSPADQPFAARRFKQFVYDDGSRLTAVVAPSVRHADGQVRPTVTRYEYDELGNQTAQIDAEGRITTYAYDNAGRRISRTLPGGQTEQMQYDGAGRMRFRTDFNGRITEFRYDVMGRLRFRVSDPVLGEPTVEWRYTSAGQRERMIDASGTTIYGYDSRGRLTSKATAAGTLGYTYDAAGNIRSIASSSRDGAAMLYSYDELNRLATVTDANEQVVRYGYDEVGNLGSVSLPNGVVSGYSYNAIDRLKQLTHSSAANAQALLAGYSYGLAANGQRVVAADANGRTSSYRYDALGRLEQEVISGDQSLPTARNGQIGYVYDAVGNRLSRTNSVAGLAPQAFGYDSNDRVQGDSYDQNGNTVAAPISQPASALASLPKPATGNPQPVIGTDVYDSQDRLRERTGANGARVQVIYDGDGHKVREVVTQQGSSMVTSYLVDELNPTGYAQVVEEKTNGTLTRVYTYGLDLISQDQLIGSAASGTWKLSYYGYDGHGNVRFLTDETGAVTDRYDFDAFGTLLSIEGSTPNLYLYCGEAYDGALGLYYLRARLMNPLTGRFWTADTYEGQNSDPASLHKYLYANADSVNGWDPSGFFSVLELNAVNVIRAIGNEANLVAGTTAADTVLYGPIVASANIYTGAAITAGAAAALPFARAIAAPLSKFGRLASEALPGGIVGLSRLSFRCRVLALPYEMLLETMKLAGMTARGYEAGHLLPDAIFTAIPRSHGLAIPMFGSVAEQYSQHWKFHRTLEVAWDVSLRIRGRFPNVGEFLDNILPDALQNADMDPYTASILAEACKEQALKFGYALKDQLPKLFRNTKQ